MKNLFKEIISINLQKKKNYDILFIKIGSQMQVGPNSRKESDVMFRARDRATNGPREEDGREYPTLICEVAYTHPATYDELSDLLSDWLSAYTTVMIAIGIKIGI